MVDIILESLYQLQDRDYRDFQCRLMPTVDLATVIGVRTPQLRQLSKTLVKRADVDAFLLDLPHAYFDLNQLHAFVLSEMKDFDRCVAEVDRFLPYVDNWATCDQLSPKAFRAHRDALLPHVLRWIASEQTYTIRFGVGMLLEHYLDGDFDPVFPELVAALRSEEYYVNMMIAWYFATALAKQYAQIVPYIENRRLDAWTHNKAIQKAVESRRITPEQKAYLKTLKIRKG